MTLPNNLSNSPSTLFKTNTQIVAITTVDLAKMKAIGSTRQQSALNIDLRYHVGAIHVTPAVGEQWTIQRFGTCWALVSKLPKNTTDLLTVPAEGQVQIGSTGVTQGPLHLNGSQINVNGPLVTQVIDSSTRPDPTSVPVGTQIYDAGLKMPIWSNGTNWHDASGHEYPAHRTISRQVMTITTTASAT